MAYSFGGDTDTIGAMAGAMAGAHFGLEGISEKLQVQCEEHQHVMDLAKQLFECRGKKQEG